MTKDNEEEEEEEDQTETRRTTVAHPLLVVHGTRTRTSFQCYGTSAPLFLLCLVLLLFFEV